MPIFMPPHSASAANGDALSARNAAALPPSMRISRRLNWSSFIETSLVPAFQERRRPKRIPVAAAAPANARGRSDLQLALRRTVHPIVRAELGGPRAGID